MSDQSNRSTILGAGILVGLAIALAVSIYLAYRGPAARTVSVDPVKAPGPRVNRGTPSWPAMTYDDGTMWQLTGVHEYPDGAWWGGDGLPIAEPKAPPVNVKVAAPETSRLLEFRYRCVSKDAHGGRVRFEFPDNLRAYATNYQSQSNTVGTGSVAFSVPEDLERLDLQVGVTAPDWTRRLEATVDALKSPASVTTRPAIVFPGVAFGEILYDAGALKVELVDDRPIEQRMQYYSELAAVRKSGKALNRMSRMTTKADNRMVYAFTMPADQVAGVVFQTKDFKWLTMEGIPLRPKSPATTQSASSL